MTGMPGGGGGFLSVNVVWPGARSTPLLVRHSSPLVGLSFFVLWTTLRLLCRCGPQHGSVRRDKAVEGGGQGIGRAVFLGTI